jgi:hypothetical protein
MGVWAEMVYTGACPSSLKEMNVNMTCWLKGICVASGGAEPDVVVGTAARVLQAVCKNKMILMNSA